MALTEGDAADRVYAAAPHYIEVAWLAINQKVI
jgi:hypothetical protein